MTSESLSRRTRFLLSTAIGLWLAVQLALPLHGFLTDRYQSRGRFSWNMFAHRYPCKAGYRYETADGRLLPVNPAEHLVLSDRSLMIFRANTLPAFHSYLCDEMERREGQGNLRGQVQCSLDQREPRTLISPEIELCAPGRTGGS